MQVKTRFAPSPTGYLHIGGARTALFNWLFAKQNNGSFVLRIEDTDRSRHVDDSPKKIMNDLEWLGLQWNEGPYYQSERLNIYQKYIDQLINSGHAYRDKDSQAVYIRANGQQSFYFTDLIKGESSITSSIEDFVIQKSDGFPTYHLACVVDDYEMKITHIIRGQEHQTNTYNHLLLQKALNIPSPTYLHIPIILNSDGSKMSKRDKEKAIAEGRQPPSIEVKDFKVEGYTPEALLNYISLLGWSPGNNEEYFTIDKLTQKFNIRNVGDSNARFDKQKLTAFNTYWSAQLDPKRLVYLFKEYLWEFESIILKASDEELLHLLNLCHGYRTFEDVKNKIKFLYTPNYRIQYDANAIEKFLQPNDKQGFKLLRIAYIKFEPVKHWTTENIKAVLDEITQQNGIQFKEIAQPIRIAITGSTISPEIVESLRLLGLSRTLHRLFNCLILSK